ncbi:CapA family protein [Nocardiopsis sediminis]|uniref:CapA family protein n=1 Tax=Nocardiopsis sediminis TaxID=1778267 RepID=A0ABV8FLZ5_9ACTN
MKQEPTRARTTRADGAPALQSREEVSLMLCGDVMTGRGIDQILPHPLDPLLREPGSDDARGYVALAEAAHGPVPRPAGFDWPWGDVLAAAERFAPDVRLINLETSVTRSSGFASGKAVHYRMSPENLPALGALRPDACALANNHVLDFGRQGLLDTLDALAAAGLRGVGAGRDAEEARRPAVITTAGGRVAVFSCGMASSGIPPDWAATADRPGVQVLRDRAGTDADADNDDGLADRIREQKRAGAVVVVSVHWGSNWGYDIDPDLVETAHALVDAGADLVHGHSSHHPRPIEVYRDRLILYGCGDTVNDYEGIPGYARFRDDLRLVYLASVDAQRGNLVSLRMIPLRARRLRLESALATDADWLRATLDRVSHPFGVTVDRAPDGMLTVSATNPP